MLKRSAPALFALAAVAAVPCLASTHGRHSSSSVHSVASHAAKARAVSSHVSAGRSRSQGHSTHVAVIHREAPPAMETARATEIQTALIHAGYLAGEPTGVWDTDSIAAMQKMQDANGWQTKFVPDSRALLKLGLGGGATSSVLPAAQPAVVAESITVAPADR